MKKIDLASPVEVLCYAALVLGFCLFLRRSNLAPDTGVSFNPQEQLTRNDVWQVGQLTMVDVKWNKTNQYKQRELVLLLIPAKNKTICPVHWMKLLYSRFLGDSQMALFSYPKHGKNGTDYHRVVSKEV